MKVDKGTCTFSLLNNNIREKSSINSLKNRLKIKRLDLNNINYFNDSISESKKNHSLSKNNYPTVFQYKLVRKRNIEKPKGNQTLTLLSSKLLKSARINKKNLNDNNNNDLYYNLENSYNDLNFKSVGERKKSSKMKLVKNNKGKIKFSNDYINETFIKMKKKAKNKEKNKYRESSSYSKREISLFDNPNSFFYVLFHHPNYSSKIKPIKGKSKKNDIVEEYRQAIKENKNEVFNQLYLLKKDINKAEQKIFFLKYRIYVKLNKKNIINKLKIFHYNIKKKK